MTTYTYFPSCNLTIASPASSKKMREYLQDKMNIAGCCRFDTRTYDEDAIGLTVCQACRSQLEDKVKIETLWQYIAQDPDFVFPDYHGLCVHVQDCYRDKEHPEVASIIRQLLHKMHVTVVECDGLSDFCGTLHYEPQSESLRKQLASYPDTEVSKLPQELQIACMQEHVAHFSDLPIVCDCNRCVKGITLGGGKAIHLMDLLWSEANIG